MICSLNGMVASRIGPDLWPAELIACTGRQPVRPRHDKRTPSRSNSTFRFHRETYCTRR